jgi:hypothetical protein
VLRKDSVLGDVEEVERAVGQHGLAVGVDRLRLASCVQLELLFKTGNLQPQDIEVASFRLVYRQAPFVQPQYLRLLCQAPMQLFQLCPANDSRFFFNAAILL